MNSLERLTTPQAALASQQATPGARSFRATQAGRLAGDPIDGTPAVAFSLRRWPDGTCDLVRLDCDGRDYLDLGGKGSEVVVAGRI